MGIRVALHHRTQYQYDRPVSLFPQVARLRPAPHCRTPILSYSFRATPTNHFLNWQQDPHGNYLARLVFPEKTTEFTVEVDLVADLTVINPFDFFLEPEAVEQPFEYASWLSEELKPYLKVAPVGPRFAEFFAGAPREDKRTIDFLVALNSYTKRSVKYLIREEPGVQTCEETLEKASGSCRDSAWLLVQLMRQFGFASRFVSGYLIQLKPDLPSIDGPTGAEVDFTDLHAWTEVYLPGAGWVGMDPTSGLLAGEGHLPLAGTPDPISAAPITGSREACESTMKFDMSVRRLAEKPRSTKPYSDEVWQDILAMGNEVEKTLKRSDVRLTMGGEPTFVSIDDYESPQWNHAALGAEKRQLAGKLFNRLANRFAKSPLLHYGQGKWYPGESLPRWALTCYWRKDGEAIWQNPSLIARDDVNYGHTNDDSKRFIEALAERLGVNAKHMLDGYEDAWYYMWRERRLPANVDPLSSNLDDKEERDRLSKVFEQGLNHVVGHTLPLAPIHGGSKRWRSGPWFLRREHMFLIPGDSAMGFRLPLDSLPWYAAPNPGMAHERDPFDVPAALPARALWDRIASRDLAGHDQIAPDYIEHAFGGMTALERNAAIKTLMQTRERGRQPRQGSGVAMLEPLTDHDPVADNDDFRPNRQAPFFLSDGRNGHTPDWLVRTAICAEPRGGQLHIFMPPVPFIEDYLELVAAVEDVASDLQTPVRIEGYPPPRDPRITHFRITPDPGVIEVNMQPVDTWDELVHVTTTLYEEARFSRLGTEKFLHDGRHVGTGGGNHVVVGSATASSSPFLRRPDLLSSFVSYWNNHPSLSYLFSGLFIGPTSQAPRVDEARHESIYELQTAMQTVANWNGPIQPWLVDRIFRHLLADLTGNTHRTEFCIDKLFDPDSTQGRLGLVELRAFEMPPDAKMSMAQQLLVRTLIASFWNKPYREPLVRWGTSLHDKFMLSHFVRADFNDVIEELRTAGFDFHPLWFEPHFEFRFPLLGEVTHANVHLELRGALEPWHTLGEEGSSSGTARYVDSSLERVEVKIQGLTDTRHLVVCNGRRLPLHPTGTQGEHVAGVRYRAWQPPSCLHPTIGIHSPLVFDVLDRWSGRSIGGCTWHVTHPGGRSYEVAPVNAYEAESRRVNRFQAMGHTAGFGVIPPPEVNPDYPHTLDLRRPIELGAWK